MARYYFIFLINSYVSCKCHNNPGLRLFESSGSKLEIGFCGN